MCIRDSGDVVVPVIGARDGWGGIRQARKGVCCLVLSRSFYFSVCFFLSVCFCSVCSGVLLFCYCSFFAFSLDCNTFRISFFLPVLGPSKMARRGTVVVVVVVLVMLSVLLVLVLVLL